MRRPLALRKDTLTELAADDLRGVAGGSAATCYSCLDCVWDLTEALVNDYDIPTLQSPCATR